MNNNTAAGKTSSDSGSATGLDRWSQRRLQRLNTEQGFREQRQGGSGSSGGPASILSPAPSNEHVFSQSNSNHYSNASLNQHDSVAQPQSLHQPSQPQTTYSSSRSGSNAGLGLQGSNNSNSHSRSPNAYAAQSHDLSHQQQQQQQQQQYSPPDNSSSFQTQATRQPIQQSRGYQQQQSSASNAVAVEADSTSMPISNGAAVGTKSGRTAVNNRQSMHNELASRESSNVSHTHTHARTNMQVCISFICSPPVHNAMLTLLLASLSRQPRRHTTTSSTVLTHERRHV